MKDSRFFVLACDFGRGIHLTPILIACAAGCGIDVGALAPVSIWHLIGALLMAWEVKRSFDQSGPGDA
jgi:hypothetical protein